MTMLLPAATNLTVKLAWDPSPDNFVEGYRLYWGPLSGTNYTGSLNTTNLTAIVSNLAGGQTYFFVVTAYATNYDGSLLESDPSNEVRTNAPPDIGGVLVTSTIEGLTNRQGAVLPLIPFTVQNGTIDTNKLTSSNPGLLPQTGILLSALTASGTMTLNPAPTAIGRSTVLLTATNSMSTSSVAFVLTTRPNAPPDVTNDNYPVNEDGSLISLNILGKESILRNASDAHPGVLGETNVPIRLVQITSTANGILTLSTNGTFTYVPNANFFGVDTFTYRAVDSLGATSALATVTITVAPTNDPPTAVNDVLPNVIQGTGPWTNSMAKLLTNDLAGPSNESSQILTIIAVTNPIGGTVAIVGTNIVFTPTDNTGPPTIINTGPASFSYTMRDNGQSGSPATNDFKSATATVSFNVVAYNYPPTANTDALTNVVSGPFTIAHAELLKNDLKGTNESWQTLTITAVNSVNGGTAAIVGTNVVFTPTTNYTGPASFGYTVQDDGLSGSPPVADPKASATLVSFTVSGANHPPVITKTNTLTLYPGFDATMSIAKLLASASDPDGDKLVLLSVTSPSANGGTIIISQGGVVYSPPGNLSTNLDTFMYTVGDGRGGQATGRVEVATLTATIVFQPPTVVNGFFQLKLDSIPGLLLRIQQATDLSSTNWVTIATNAVSSSGVFLYSVPLTTTNAVFRAVYP